MNVSEFATAAQSLPPEQLKELIRTLFQQLPKTESLTRSVVKVGDLEAGTRELRERVNASLQYSVSEVNANEAKVSYDAIEL